MFFKPWTKRFLHLWWQDTVHRVEPEFPCFTNEITVQELQSFEPLIWSRGLTVQEEKHLDFYLTEDGRQELSFMPQAALDHKERIRFQFWHSKIKRALPMTAFNGIQFTILEE